MKKDFLRIWLSCPDGSGAMVIAGLPHCSEKQVGPSAMAVFNASGDERGWRFCRKNKRKEGSGWIMALVKGSGHSIATMTRVLTSFIAGLMMVESFEHWTSQWVQPGMLSYQSRSQAKLYECDRCFNWSIQNASLSSNHTVRQRPWVDRSNRKRWYYGWFSKHSLYRNWQPLVEWILREL